MLLILVLCAHWSLPLLGLGALLAFCFMPTKRVLSSVLFSFFSFLTYQIHILPYTIKEEIYNVQVCDAAFAGDGDVKWGVLNQYASSYFRGDRFLEWLWQDLKGKGFDALIVREFPFPLIGEVKTKENLRIFRKESYTQSYFLLALKRQEVLEEQLKERAEPVVWIDMKPADWEDSPYLFTNIQSPNRQDWEEGIGLREGDIIRLPFKSLEPNWFSVMSSLDMTVIRFYL